MNFASPSVLIDGEPPAVQASAGLAVNGGAGRLVNRQRRAFF